MVKNKYDITPLRKEELAELAEYIADKYFDNIAVCPFKLLEIYGITYSFGDYGNAFDGLLEHKSGKFHIYLNSNKVNNRYEVRARFTLAHELGHYIIDEHRIPLSQGIVPAHASFTNFSSENEVEIEADFFASCLLLPSNRVRRDIFKRKFNFNIIEELSTKYQASITATLIKFISIGNHPIMIVCSINSKIKWFKYSEGFPFPFINAEPGFKVPRATSAGEYFYENGSKNENRDEIVFAEDWFKINKPSDKGRKFFERCIYADKSKFVLSIIWEN